MIKRFQTYEYLGIKMRNECRIEGDLCYIKLTQGQETVIDVEDMHIVSGYRWFSCKSKTGAFYAQRASHKPHNDKRITVRMHRLILKYEKHLIVDHRNHITLDNRRSNIREITRGDNQLNRVSGKGTSSVYLGVNWHKINKIWCAQMRVGGKKVHIGSFKNEREAAIMRARAFVKEYGIELNPDQTRLSKETI